MCLLNLVCLQHTSGSVVDYVIDKQYKVPEAGKASCAEACLWHTLNVWMLLQAKVAEWDHWTLLALCPIVETCGSLLVVFQFPLDILGLIVRLTGQMCWLAISLSHNTPAFNFRAGQMCYYCTVLQIQIFISIDAESHTNMKFHVHKSLILKLLKKIR